MVGPIGPRQTTEKVEHSLAVITVSIINNLFALITFISPEVSNKYKQPFNF